MEQKAGIANLGLACQEKSWGKGRQLEKALYSFTLTQLRYVRSITQQMAFFSY